MRLGEAVVEVTHALDRCVVVNASPATGEQDWAGLKTLAALRSQPQARGTTPLNPRRARKNTRERA